jgi:cell division septation protein DedD
MTPEADLAQDDYFYEIQLTNKQLVFYFLAGATGLILSFLAGVMVGRGVDQGAEVHAARPVSEERVIAEETPKPAPPAAEDLSYAQRLQSDKPEDTLEKPRTLGGGAASPAATPASPRMAAAAPPVSTPPAVTERPAARPTPAARPAPKPTPRATPAPAAAGQFTIQVGAFKDKASADAVVSRLKSKGFAAYAVTPEGEGLFNVRVGHFAGRADAERVQTRLRDQEKFQPFIVKN